MRLEDVQFLRDIALQLAAPLLRAGDSPADADALLHDLGFKPPVPVTAFAQLAGLAPVLQELIDAVETANETDDENAASEAASKLLAAAAPFIKSIVEFGVAIDDNFSGSTILTETDIVQALPRKLLDYVIVKFLEDYYGAIFAGLLILGVIERKRTKDAETPFHVEYISRTVRWETLPDYFSKPLETITGHFTSADQVLVFRILQFMRLLGQRLGLPAGFFSPEPAMLRALNNDVDLSGRPEFADFVALSLPLVDDPNVDVELLFYPRFDPAQSKYSGIAMGARFGASIDIPLGEQYRLALKLSASAADGLGVSLDRDGSFHACGALLSGNPEQLLATTEFGARIAFEHIRSDEAPKFLDVGIPGGRFEIASASFAVAVERQAAFRVLTETDLRGGKIILKSDSADGFLAKLLPKDGIEAEFDLGFGIASDAGLYFKGTSGLEIKVPLHLQLGPIEIINISVGVRFKPTSIPITVATSLSAKLGPLAAVVENIGIRLDLTTPPNHDGNLGPLNLGLGFKPPNGVGLSINAGVVKGGGYLYFDFDEGEYAGALELTFADFLSLKAIGLISTKMPDGTKGFSLLIIITVEFNPGFQLGYGFKLIGVGGLLGLNRTMILGALAEGVRTGAVNGIMFPVDPVANAPRILSDLRTIFPPALNRFLIGPMAKIGWGTPTVISLELGIIIEIPGNIAILGVLRLSLGDNDGEPVLVLQVNFIGALEFDKKRGWFFAAIFNSRILTITIEGEIGVLIAVGDDANFLISAGGFHPLFTPPPLPFPSPKRIALSLIDSDYASIRVETYFALTTNSVQIGVKAQLKFDFSVIVIEGHFAFDALLQFVPLFFIVEVSAGVTLKVGGAAVCNVDLKLALEGPTPWRARGHAEVALLCFKVSKDFDETWGDAVTSILDPVSLLEIVTAEIRKAENWRALPPPTANLLVTLRTVAPSELILHPLGTLEFSQNALPLDLRIDKVGDAPASDLQRVGLTPSPPSAGAGASAPTFVKRGDARRSFAPAQFQKMTDAQKISAPAFQSAVSGVLLGVTGAELRTGRAVRRSVRYEETTIDTHYRRIRTRFVTFGARLFEHFSRGAANSKNSRSKTRRTEMQPEGEQIRVFEDGYSVAYTIDNRPAHGGFETESAARDWMASAVDADPRLATELHVIPTFETRVAA